MSKPTTEEKLNALAANVERNHLQRIVTTYVPATDTQPAKIKAMNTMANNDEALYVEVGSDMELAEYHDWAALQVAESLDWTGKYYLLRAITNWGDEVVHLSGFIYLLRDRSYNSL
jgi:hypothetical protein